MKLLAISALVFLSIGLNGKAMSEEVESQSLEKSDVTEISTPLKEAFAKARKERNAAISLVEFWKTDVFVIVEKASDTHFYPAFTRSPNKEKWAVTVAEKEEWLKADKWPKMKLSGGQIIQMLGEDKEIVIVYPDGGDYITSNQLSWIREQLKE